MVFVFESNLAGGHGAGAALYARQHYGAVYGQAIGRQGNSYAVPTKDENLKSLPLWAIEQHVQVFLQYAKDHPDIHFFVTRVGCGLAGYTEADIAPMFKNAPTNCELPQSWRAF